MDDRKRPDHGIENETADEAVHVRTKTRKRKTKKAKPAWYYFVWLLVCICLGVLIGFWTGRNSVYKSFESLNTMAVEPELVSEQTITMETLNILYEQSEEFVPNTGFNTVYFGAQLFSSEDYYIFIHDSEGNEYHAPLAQCKLSMGDEDPNSVTIKEFKGVEHPYIIFHMDSEEFSTNVSPLFMEGFSDGMVNFVYQFLAETLPLAE